MKSKIYSSRYMKISSKGMIWIPAFVTIGFLLAFPVTELIMLGNWFGMEYTAEQISLLYENLWRNGFMVSGLAVAALAALFNGISQFWYLYSPRKIDFYHSLPVKRSRMFWYKSLQSLLYFLLPYLVMEFFSVCIGAMRGFFSLHLMRMAFVMLVFHLLLYLLLYFSVVLVICITGHLLMGALLLVAAAAYGPVFSVLLDLYERAFYYTRSESSYCLVKVLKELISPVALAYTFVKKYAEGNYGGMLIAVLLVTAVLGGLGYCAFVHRKSERTGMAFVFPWAGTAVKFLVVVSGGLGIGFVFYMLSNDSSRTIWWIFGLILGTILSGGIMEIIYYRDFRKFFSHKLQFAVNGVCVALVACVFFFDLTGYDEYIPSYDKIENIAIGSADNGWEIAYNVKVNEDGTVAMLDSGDSVGNDLGVDQNIYEIMKKLAKESKAAYKEILQDSHSMWSSNLWDPSGNTLGIKVRYDLKSGSVVYRKYMVGLDDIKNLWKEGMTEGTLKSEYYSILELDDKYVDEVKCDFITGQSISLFQDNKAKKQLLVDALRQDIKEADSEVLTGEPCAGLSIGYSGVPSVESVNAMATGQTGNYYFSPCFYVFPQFKRTVEILKETGYPISMDDVDLSSVEVQYYMDEYHNEVSSPIVYDQPEQLKELKKVLRCYQLVPFWEKREEESWDSLKVVIGGVESEAPWAILEKDVPEFMKEDSQRALSFEVLEEE